MSGVRTVTDDSFAAEVEHSPRPVLVEYWAQWCPPCRLVGPVLEAIAAEHVGAMNVVKLNIDDNPKTAQKYGVLHVPTMSLFAGGRPVKEIVGARSKAALEREFAEYLQPAREPLAAMPPSPGTSASPATSAPRAPRFEA
jgi:thioredoxin 1